MATITQRVMFKNASPKKVYRLYMNAKLHSHITAGPVKVSERIGGQLRAFGGYITGKTLLAVKNALIIQSWRGSDWRAKDPDSVFILSFEKKGRNTTMHMCHANVPSIHARGLSQGWNDHYWNPWKEYLAGRTITRPEM